jgi:hypothetical protein
MREATRRQTNSRLAPTHLHRAVDRFTTMPAVTATESGRSGNCTERLGWRVTIEQSLVPEEGVEPTRY